MRTADKLELSRIELVGKIAFLSSERRWKEIESLLQERDDEAIAHGMTISAEICKTNKEYDEKLENHRSASISLENQQNIITARDNKVWRKE